MIYSLKPTFRDNLNKVPLSVHIAYFDGKKSYADNLHIDFDTYATFFSVNNDIDDLLKEMKMQSRELKKISNVLMSMFPRTTDIPHP